MSCVLRVQINRAWYFLCNENVNFEFLNFNLKANLTWDRLF